MDRRRILLVAAVLVAAMGAVLVFLYVQGADSRAEERFDTVDVLKATAVIEPGEKIEDAQAAGKLALAAVAQDELLNGYQTDTSTIAGTTAMQTIYPGEQIVSDKFGTGVAASSALQFTDDTRIAMSVNLTDPSRVAGFVNPGSEVAIFLTGTDTTAGAEGTPFSRLLLDRGHRHGRRQHHAGVDDHHRRVRGVDDRAASPHPAHHQRRPATDGEGPLRAGQR